MVMDRVEILRAACCIAGLDSKVCDAERAMLQQIAAHAGVGSASLQAMIERAEQDSNFYQQQFRIIQADADATLHALFCIAAADHHLHDNERVILQYFADKLGLSQQRFDQFLAAAQRKEQNKPAGS